jgi:hypothetical protein
MSGPAPPDCFFPGDRCLQLDIGAALTPALSQTIVFGMRFAPVF